MGEQAMAHSHAATLPDNHYINVRDEAAARAIDQLLTEHKRLSDRHEEWHKIGPLNAFCGNIRERLNHIENTIAELGRRQPEQSDD